MGFVSSFFSNLFSPPPTPRMPATQLVVSQAPVVYDNSAAEAAAVEAAAKQKKAAALAKGRAASLLSGGEGVTSEAPVKLKQALGE